MIWCFHDFTVELRIFCIVTYYSRKHSILIRRRSNSSWASHFTFVGNECDQPKLVAKIYAHLKSLLDAVVANNIALYTFWGIFYTAIDDHLSWTAYIRMDAMLCRCHAVGYGKSYKFFLSEIPHFFARTKWSSPYTYSWFTCSTCNDDAMTKLSNTVT